MLKDEDAKRKFKGEVQRRSQLQMRMVTSPEPRHQNLRRQAKTHQAIHASEKQSRVGFVVPGTLYGMPTDAHPQKEEDCGQLARHDEQLGCQGGGNAHLNGPVNGSARQATDEHPVLPLQPRVHDDPAVRVVHGEEGVDWLVRVGDEPLLEDASCVMSDVDEGDGVLVVGIVVAPVRAGPKEASADWCVL